MAYGQAYPSTPRQRPQPMAAPQPTQNQQYALQRLGDFVPEERRQAIARTGISDKMQSIMRLNDQGLADQTTGRYDTIKRMWDERDRYAQGATSVQPEMKKLQRQDQLNAAKKIVEDNRWGPNSNHIGVQAAQQVLANQDIYNADGPGTVLAAQGNMSEYLSDKNASQELRQRAADNDFLAQYEYDPNTAYKGGWGFGYKSMATDANQIHSDTTAFGGDGHQAAIQDMQAGNDARYAERNQQKWDAAMQQSQERAGKYIGASPEYLSNIKTWSKQPNNLWVDEKGKLARMNYNNEGGIDSVSSRVGDTYTPRANPDGKYQNWNWIRDQVAAGNAPKPTAQALSTPQAEPEVASNTRPAADVPPTQKTGNGWIQPLSEDPVGGYENSNDWQRGDDALAQEEEAKLAKNYGERDGRLTEVDAAGRPLDERGAKLGTADAFIRSGGDSKYLEPDTTRLGVGQEDRNATPRQIQQVPPQLQKLYETNPQAALDAYNQAVTSGGKLSDIKAPTGDQRATGGDLVGNSGNLRFINNESTGRYGGVDRVLQPGDTSAANVPNTGINSEEYAKRLTSMTLPGLPAMMAVAEAPQLTRGDAAYNHHANNPMAAGMIDVAMNNMGATDNRAKPASRPQDLAQFDGAFGGRLAPSVLDRKLQGDLFDNSLAGPKIEKANQVAEATMQQQIALQNAADPRQQVIANGFKKLMTTNPPMAKFLSAIYRH